MPSAVQVILSLSANGFSSGLKKASGDAKNAAGDIDGAFSKNRASLDKVGSGALLAGAAIAGGLAVAIKAGADFDTQMSSVTASVKANGEGTKATLDALRQAAIEAGAQTSFSASEAAQGLDELAKAGVSAKDSLSGGLSGALDLAAAGGLDVAEAAETAATAMTQFGLSGKDVPHIADLLAAGAGKAQGSVHDLGMALKQGGLVASQFGLSVEDTTGTLAAFAKNGLIGSDAGTSFKTMLISLANPSAKSAAQMKELGLNAYDAQGQFIGITELAGQLQQKLGGLTQAQRNQALAQIFGTDAIRAGNILYSEGAAGIQNMIDATDDLGFAQETASTKLDNLNGDIEGLRGSIESAFIESTTGANAGLRDLVQGLTDAVNWFNSLPAAVQTGAVKVVAFGAAALLGLGGVIKMVGAVQSLKSALVTLNLVSASGGMTGLGKAGVKASIGLLAAAAAFTAIDKLGNGTGTLAETTSQLLDLSKNGDKAAASVKDLNTAFTTDGNGFDAFIGKTDNLGTALQYLTNNKGIGWLNGLEKAAEALAPGTQAFESYADGVKQVDTGLTDLVSKGNTEAANKAFAQIAAQAKDLGLSNEDLIKSFSGYSSGFTDQANALGGVSVSAEEMVGWMSGKVPPAIAAAAAAAGEGAPDIAGLGDSADSAAADFQSLIDKSIAASNALLQMRGSEVGFQAAIDDAAKALKDNGKGLDIHTAKGRANRTALDAIASSALNLAQAKKDEGAADYEVAEAMTKGRNAYIRAAEAMTGNRDKAVELANAIFGIPKNPKITVHEDGSKVSKTDIDNLHAAIDDVPKDKRTVLESVWKSQGYDAAVAAYNSLAKSKTTTLTTVHEDIYYRRTVTKKPGGGQTIVKGPEFGSAAGGFITGPGTGTSDSIPVNLSNGEFVVRAAAVKAVGLGALQEINRQGYANGGLVRDVTLASGLSGAQSLIKALERPVLDLASATSKLNAAAEAQKRSSLAEAKPLRTLRARREDVTEARSALSRANRAAAPTKAQTKRVNQLQAAYDKANAAAGKSVSKNEQKRLDNLSTRLSRAKELAEATGAQQAAVDRAEAKLQAAESSRDKASTAYQAALDATKRKADALKQAEADRLALQQQLADAARQVSDTFRGAYDSQTADAGDWLALMKDGASDIGAFTKKIQALRKAGLSETLVQQIIGMGAIAGTDVANQIAAGGKTLVDGLNKANQGIQDAADQLGYVAATGQGRYALGGPVWGPGTGSSDSIHARLSNGEYVVNSVATAKNRAALDAMNYGRQVVDVRAVDGYRYGGLVRRAGEAGAAAAPLQVNINGPLTPDPYAIADRILTKQRDALAVSGAGRRI